jgi:hypothetical protein
VVRSEAEVLLDKPGCPACRRAADAGQTFFAWFRIETHTGQPMLAALRASLGDVPEAHALVSSCSALNSCDLELPTSSKFLRRLTRRPDLRPAGAKTPSRLET